MDIQLTLVRFYYKLFSAVAPKSAGFSAFKMFQKVRKKSIRPRENHFFESANHFTINTKVGEIDCYKLGEENKPTVVLVHGWDSNAGSLSSIAFELVEQGYQILTFNLPGHAFSKKDRTNLYECRMVLNALLDHQKLFNNFSIVSHSFGSAITAYTLANKQSCEVDKLVFLTNPNKVESIFEEFKEMIGLGNRAYLEMLRLTETVIEEPIGAISVEENLKKSSFNQLLLIHDKFDKVLPFENSVNVHEKIENSELISFEKIGHYKMLWNEEVKADCINFLKN